MEKVVVEGTVQYDGEPVANGDIKFYPVEGTPGPVSGAAIKDGRYVVRNKDGVPVGQHTVQIRGFRVTQASGDDDLISSSRAPTTQSSRGQYLPDKYNRATELIVEVTSESRTIDFDLKE